MSGGVSLVKREMKRYHLLPTNESVFQRYLRGLLSLGCMPKTRN